ncbi:MAG: CrcB family protein [Fimbriimonadaceae bacterium]|nr:CrcB family protein [Fimbriimonadaceae bacterium]
MKPAEAAGIFLASGLGGLVRAWIGTVLAPTAGGLPYGTLAVNGIGALVIGVLIGVGLAPESTAYRVLAIGFLGGFTTFSAFAGETVRLGSDQPMQAGGYVMLTVFGGLGLAWLGSLLGHALAPR